MKPDALKELHSLDAAARRLSRVAALLQWDQETCLPPAAVEERAEQLADIEGLRHERATDPRIGKLLQGLGSTEENPLGDESLPDIERRFLRVMRRFFDRQVRLPRDFVEAMARDQGLSQAAWVSARKADDFAVFVPHLRAMVDYARRRAEYWGFPGKPYDALIDEYEPGMTEERISSLFVPLAAGLTELLGRIASKPRPDASFLEREYPAAEQEAFCSATMAALGFDLRRGRLDRSAHPFTTTLGPDDVRITTRYFPGNVLSGLFSVIHETGHALYELGFDDSIRGSSLADGASMGIHESQSRLWENVVGRSRAFWRGRFPAFRQAFPGLPAGVDAERLYRAANAVRPSLIRVDADEVSYGLHVVLRFELERRLISGGLRAEELPAAWRELMRSLVGAKPENDADGVLQDVHWSMGAFGYFPSYALGNLYGAQFWNALRADLPDAEARVERGDFGALLDWLRVRVHRLGRAFTPEELVRSVCGGPVAAEPFLEYLEEKYADLYGL